MAVNAMTNLLEVHACSGSKWDKNPTTTGYILNEATLAAEFDKNSLGIKSVRHVDGITETPSFVSPSDNHFYGSGSLIIDTEELGEIAVSAWARFDSNPNYSHEPSGAHININLYWYQKLPNGNMNSGEIKDIKKHPVHGKGLQCRKGRIKLIDLYNGGKEFSDHPLDLF